MKRFDHKESLIQAMKSGINLFVGAGFSVHAKDVNNVPFPSGKKLLEELQKEFGPGINDLPKYCSIMERKNRTGLYTYLTQRFITGSFDECYLNLNYLNLKGVYTTNIDDLVPKIVSHNKNRYINEQSVNGDCSNDRGINYMPLHGYVKYPEQGYVFSVEKISNIYNTAPKLWSYLSLAIEKYPTLFIGYAMSDTGVIDTVLSQKTFKNAQKSMWIVLYNPSDDEIEYFESLGFSIIVAETKEFLDLIPSLTEWKQQKSHSNQIEDFLGANIIPKDDRGLVHRPIEEFYRGMAPTWIDIQRNVIYRTSFYKDIENSVNHPSRHTIITGSPISGKTTLAMLVGYFIRFEGTKLMFDHLTMNRAEYIVKIIDKAKALIIVDNFTDDVDAFIHLTTLRNVKLIGVDRSHNYAIINHKISPDLFDVINVTELQEQDIQGIMDAIPAGIRKSKETVRKKQKNDQNDSIYEFVIRHIEGQSIEDRYKGFVRSLEKENPDLLEFLVLCAYMNQARVPLSMEVAYQYFSDKNYREVIDMRKQLTDFLQEDDDEWLVEQNIDGYRPRTSIVSNAILKSVKSSTLADVMWNVIDNVYYVTICNYHTFRKWAFDKSLVKRAFPDWRDGKEFYEEVFLFDNRNPFVLQQGALYLSSKRQYHDAFDWIDKAMVLTNNQHFSIRNSHAIILFDANYDVQTPESRNMLEQSMETLHDCYTNDKRRTYHAQVYADQALRYYRKYPDNKALEYLTQAKVWLKDELSENHWAYELKPLLSRITSTLEHERS